MRYNLFLTLTQKLTYSPLQAILDRDTHHGDHVRFRLAEGGISADPTGLGRTADVPA
ncbi:hypothetical protein MTBLM5_350028 [Magnetospirillum sp. LM-5]|nr:hypothetical protein MTBLM5_350028 [Magnetospirillum sp. LM-5]